VDIKYEQAALDRFPSERAAFREEPRLRADSLPPCEGPEELDWLFVLKGCISIVRLADLYTEQFFDLCMERLTDQHALMEHLDIPILQDTEIEKPLHNKAVPVEGAYLRLRTQAYWLALHVWLLHSKQHLVQAEEGLFGSALCALVTRRIFEEQWTQIRVWMMEADVPVMSLTSEVQDMQEFIFGLCVALDDAFREEAPNGTAQALALNEQELEGRHGLAPRVKYVLWANVYSGTIPHDTIQLQELTTYLLRQRMALEAMPRAPFLSGKFCWADFKW